MEPVSKPKGRPKTRRAPHLEPEKVVTVALDLLNEVGFEGLTLRKLADKLGVKAAALYWHFKNKQDLIDRVACKIIEEELSTHDIVVGRSWREILTELAYGTRSALRRYRDGALVIASADLSKSATDAARNSAMEDLFRTGFAAPLVVSGMFTVERYALGTVLEEQADPLSSSPDVRRQTAAGNPEYPAIARIYQELPDQQMLSDDARFASGLELILDGVAASFDKQPN